MDPIIRAIRVGNTNGWSIKPLGPRRDWMDATHHGFAYKCLPLTIANQWGWAIYAPCGFAGTWDGRQGPGGMTFMQPNPGYVQDHFGYGIVTHSIPWLFKTPPGVEMLVGPVPNAREKNLEPLWGIVETSWLAATFTYNRRVMRVGEPFSLTREQPVCTIRPIQVSDLERFQIHEVCGSEEELKAYREWKESRRAFNANPDRSPKDWQGHYHRGENVGCPMKHTGHKSKLSLSEMTPEENGHGCKREGECDE